MKRTALVVLLLCCSVSLFGAGESNGSVANAPAALAVDAKTYKRDIVSADKKIAAEKSRWSRALSAYLKMHSLRVRLAAVEQSLQSAGVKKDAATLGKLTRRKQQLEREIQANDNSDVAAVEYYIHPVGEKLSVHDEMYSRYEEDRESLERLQALQQHKQKLQQGLMAIEPSKTLQADQQLTTYALDTIGKIEQRLRQLSDDRMTKISVLKKELADLDDELGQGNIWQKSYTAYLTYVDVKRDLELLRKKIKKINASKEPADRSTELDALVAKQKILSDQLTLLHAHSASPFADLLKPEEIEPQPQITNPIDIFSGLSYNKKINEQLNEYKKRGKELKKYLNLLLQKRQLYLQLADLDKSVDYNREIADFDAMIEKFRIAYSTMRDTADVYAKRVEEIELKSNKAIKDQVYKLGYIGAIIIFLFVFFFIMKQIAKKYISDNERFYMANKLITFVNVTLILLVLLFNYIENVSYVVTVLGFASAGIAIAMKDWFMSMLGWLVIVFGGSIHVGDRVRVDKDGKQYVGDVLDISLLRITILEDITLTTYTHNRRAGRIIFIPNNYIFTEMIANYTHVSLKTVWDGIDITITFDSNHKKAQLIAKEITRKFAKGYTDITRNQLNKLRSRYNLKNTNVEPRIYTFVEENGVRISSWYLTNAYATLTLRSTISMEIIDAFGKEDDITIAYPTQRLRLQNEPLPQPFQGGEDDGEPV